jgi:hypothetical protein
MRKATTRRHQALPVLPDRGPDSGRETSVAEGHCYLLFNRDELAQLRDGVVPATIRRQCEVQLMPFREWVAFCRNGS